MMQTQFYITDVRVAPMLYGWQSAFHEWLITDYRHISPKHQSLSGKSLASAIQHVRVFIAWWEAQYEESFSIERMTNASLRAYRKHSLNEARVRPDTWNSRLWALRIFCEWIHAELGEQYTNLADGIEPKKTESGIHPNKYRSLSNSEFRRLEDMLEFQMRGAGTPFEWMNAVRNYAMVTTMLYAGPRVSEVGALEISDITINERSGQMRIRNGKGDKERIIPLVLEARKAITKWMEAKPGITISLFDISNRQIERIVSELGAACGIDGLSPHWLRFTFAKRLEAKLSNEQRPRSEVIRIIQSLLGHESAETTEIYLRSSFDELQNAME